MAHRIAIAGCPNTGKSFSRKSIEKGEEVFVIRPSSKAMHITTSEGKPIKRLNPESKTFEEVRKGDPCKTFIQMLPKVPLDTYKFTGNYIQASLNDVKIVMDYINDYRPDIKVIILPDFTHFITQIISSKAFIAGKGFQRFWELAGSIMDNLMNSIDTLREDLIVITEYHVEYNEVLEEFELFAPGGKMTMDKFKLDSYFDFMLYTHIERPESGEVNADCYKFVTRRWGKYPARMSELFKETLIPNDLELVLTKFKEYNGI